jgi:hypothetical protein
MVLSLAGCGGAGDSTSSAPAGSGAATSSPATTARATRPAKRPARRPTRSRTCGRRSPRAITRRTRSRTRCTTPCARDGSRCASLSSRSPAIGVVPASLSRARARRRRQCPRLPRRVPAHQRAARAQVRPPTPATPRSAQPMPASPTSPTGKAPLFGVRTASGATRAGSPASATATEVRAEDASADREQRRHRPGRHPARVREALQHQHRIGDRDAREVLLAPLEIGHDGCDGVRVCALA